MKKNVRNFLLILTCAFGVFGKLQAQSISVVPNPTAPDIFAGTQDGVLSGYAGTPIVLNNTLVLEYNATTTSDPMQVKLQLAVYTGGDSLHRISNPDSGQGVYFRSIQVVFNNKLFVIYIDENGTQRLASFDGTAITLYPNPDAGLGYIGSPRIFNNTLYVAYSNAAGVTQFGTFNGSGITLIPNPDNSSIGFYNNYSVVFDNKICSRYVTAAGPKKLAIYDGTQWTLLPNPDNSTRGVTPVFPALYHNKLYFTYYSSANQYQYMEYDGVNNPTLIPNPQNSSSNDGGVAGFPIVVDDTLFFEYYDTATVGRLAKFGGSSISLVPNPDATTYGFYNTPIVYNNKLYIFYVTEDGLHHLAQYQGASNSLKVYPNPDAGFGYWDKPIVYNGKLYFQYLNGQSVFQLGYFDGGNMLNLLPNPPGVYTAPSGSNGYTGYPIIWNNLLYMQFGSIPYNDAGNLAFFDGSSLPVTLLSFTAQKRENTSLLQWKIASEINNAYFSIERSHDGNKFEPIGRVAGHGTIATARQYEFTDNKPNDGVNYYRLKQVDYDGKYTYSNIATVTFANFAALKVFPNPALNTINVTMPSYAEKSMINVYDLNGKKVFEKQVGPNTTTQPIDFSKLGRGVYNISLVQGKQQQTVQVIKQ